jgi:hypothetical protein
MGQTSQIAPPPKLATSLSIFGAVAAALLWLWPGDSSCLLWLNAAAPPLTFIPLLLWRGQFTLGGRAKGLSAPRQNLAGLWTLPSLALAMCAWSPDFERVYTAMPVIGGLALGILFAAIGALVDPKARSEMIVFLLMAGTAWGWGLLTFANVELDRTPGVIRPAVIADKDSGSRSGPTLVVGLQDSSFTDLRFRVSYSTYDSVKAGDAACVEDNPGAFGWRTLWLVECTAPLREMINPEPVG